MGRLCPKTAITLERDDIKCVSNGKRMFLKLSGIALAALAPGVLSQATFGQSAALPKQIVDVLNFALFNLQKESKR